MLNIPGTLTNHIGLQPIVMLFKPMTIVVAGYNSLTVFCDSRYTGSVTVYVNTSVKCKTIL